ncbi:Aste57867_575 [Aphanomyces stellatus]|uniref:Aste57867_575 protein n=1 Tax=Aphanomyces stellatus TaxID=120398 RepID=A0A485K726_9STRA|nr:hypothetical protein As57867_000574 [Aphanomyces stellatus]VFT77800.1 Aste57867_575 [Aphanomyces stellatus]
MHSVPSMHLWHAPDTTPSPPRALSTAMGEMHTLARGHADNATSPQMLASGHNAIKSSASMLRLWTGVALPTFHSFEAIQTIGLTVLSTMLVCIMIVVFVAIFGITATPPQRGNPKTKTHSVIVEVESAVPATTTTFVGSNSIRSPMRFSLLLADQVDVQAQQKMDQPTYSINNEASVMDDTDDIHINDASIGLLWTTWTCRRPIHSVQLATTVVATLWVDVPAPCPAPTPTAPHRISRFTYTCPPRGFQLFPWGQGDEDGHAVDNISDDVLLGADVPPHPPAPQRISRFPNACPPRGFMMFPWGQFDEDDQDQSTDAADDNNADSGDAADISNGAATCGVQFLYQLQLGPSSHSRPPLHNRFSTTRRC